jgi:hypothetical protein
MDDPSIHSRVGGRRGHGDRQERKIHHEGTKKKGEKKAKKGFHGIASLLLRFLLRVFVPLWRIFLPWQQPPER